MVRIKGNNAGIGWLVAEMEEDNNNCPSGSRGSQTWLAPVKHGVKINRARVEGESWKSFI